MCSILHVAYILLIDFTYMLFCMSNAFFSTQPNCCLTFFMNSASDVAKVLLIAHKHHHTEIHFIFSIFVTMFWSSPVYMMMIMMMMMMIVMNCFCGMVDRRTVFNLIFSRGHCQRSSSTQISDMLRIKSDPAQNLISGFAKSSWAVVITTTPRCLNIVSV